MWRVPRNQLCKVLGDIISCHHHNRHRRCDPLLNRWTKWWKGYLLKEVVGTDWTQVIRHRMPLRLCITRKIKAQTQNFIWQKSRIQCTILMNEQTWKQFSLKRVLKAHSLLAHLCLGHLSIWSTPPNPLPHFSVLILSFLFFKISSQLSSLEKPPGALDGSWEPGSTFWRGKYFSHYPFLHWYQDNCSVTSHVVPASWGCSLSCGAFLLARVCLGVALFSLGFHHILILLL